MNFEDEVNLLDSPAHGACSLFRTDYLRQISGYDELIKRQDGYDIWLKVISKYRVKNINKPLFYYRQHDNSLSSDLTKILKSRSKILSKHGSNISNKKSLVILPIRSNSEDGRSFPFAKIKGKYLIDYTIESLLNLDSIEKIIVTSSSNKILNHVDKMKIIKLVYVIDQKNYQTLMFL